MPPPLVKTRKKFLPKNNFFCKFFFPKNFKILEKFFWKKLKKFFFVSKKILCCTQEITKFCSKQKKGKLFFWEKTFYFFYTKTFFKKFLIKNTNCFVLHENVVPPLWKQENFISTKWSFIWELRVSSRFWLKKRSGLGEIGR